MNLREIKEAIVFDFDWHVQRGPNDSNGYQVDMATAAAVNRSRTWAELAKNCPTSWYPAVINRCHKNDL